ncbi:MAG TPA: CHRD domain-containing protein [Levilinea sp.]|nr:CHRD domain-containing protein [Levilinea sp.]
MLAQFGVTGTVSANGKRTFTAHLAAEAPGVETQAVGQAIFMVSKDGQSVSDLLKIFHTGEAYVNVHTQIYPGGEIRGDID